MTVRTRTLDVFGVDLHLATDVRDWGKIRRAWPEKDGLVEWGIGSLATTGACPNDNGVMQIAFRFDMARVGLMPDAELISLVAHEAFHAALSIAEHHGIPTTVEHDETTAYLVGWISAWIWHALHGG